MGSHESGPSIRDTLLPADKRQMVEQVSRAFVQLSQGERAATTDGWLLTVPRTVLDQVLRDLEKTVNKATADRRQTKSQGSETPSRRTKRQAGFPVIANTGIPARRRQGQRQPAARAMIRKLPNSAPMPPPKPITYATVWRWPVKPWPCFHARLPA